MRAADEIRLVRENLSLAMSVWRASSQGLISPNAILGPPPKEPSQWAESAVDQYSRLTRATANQVRASFALAALQAHRSLAPMFATEPIDDESNDLQAARSVLYLMHRALNEAMLVPVWDCPPRYRRLFEVRPARFTLDASNIQGSVLKWDHFGGLDKYLVLLDYSVYVAANVIPAVVIPAVVEKPTAAGVPPPPEALMPVSDRPPERPLASVQETRPQLNSPAGIPPEADAVNSVELFVVSRCELGPSCRSLAGDLYGGYVAWCQSNGYLPFPQRSFGMCLTNLGLKRRRRGRGKHWWEGIGLIDEAQAPAPYYSNYTNGVQA